jgi:hypothetical protein
VTHPLTQPPLDLNNANPTKVLETVFSTLNLIGADAHPKAHIVTSLAPEAETPLIQPENNR